MSPDGKAQRLDLIANEIDGARHLVVAGRMALDRSHANETDREQANALVELLYAIGDRLKDTAEKVRAER